MFFIVSFIIYFLFYVALSACMLHIIHINANFEEKFWNFYVNLLILVWFELALDIKTMKIKHKQKVTFNNVILHKNLRFYQSFNRFWVKIKSWLFLTWQNVCQGQDLSW